MPPIEPAKAFRRPRDRNGWSARQLAWEMDIADANVVRAPALLELPEGVQPPVEAGRRAASMASEVGRLEGAEGQACLAGRIVAEELTRAPAVAEVGARRSGRPGAARRARPKFRRDDGAPVRIGGPAAAGGAR